MTDPLRTAGHDPGPPSMEWCPRLARRSGRPLTVVRGALTPPLAAARRPEIERLVRCTDVVIPDTGGRHLELACPDTDAAGAAVAAGRLRDALAAAGRDVRCGAATFPEDGFTLE